MSQIQSRPMTPDEFLAWEAGQELKWEFDGFQPVAMTGGTFAHAVIQGNLVRALNNRLASTPCRAVGPDLKVLIGSSCRYPDVLVTCTPTAPNAVASTDPVVIFEVLSASTASDDRTVKLAEYQSLPSVRRYVMLEQDRVFATVITRTDTGWDYALAGLDGTLAIPEIGVEIPMAELYDELALAAAAQVVAPVPAPSEAP